MLGKNLIQAAAGAGAADTAWNVSNATFTGTPTNWFAVDAQDGNPFDLTFKDDGTKMYVLGGQNDSIYEYTLSTAWDITTASYSQSFSVATEDTSPEGLTFGSNGTYMYVAGIANDSVYQYTLSTAWDIGTASYTRTLSVSAQSLNPSGIFFRANGLIMYIVDGGGDVDQYNLSTAWNISTASYAGTDASDGESVFFKDDGTKMFVVIVGNSTSTNFSIREYSLSTAWDITTAGTATSTQIGGITTVTGAFVKSDGTELFVVSNASEAVYKLDLSTAWDSTTTTFTPPTSDYLYTAERTTSPQDIFFKPDGSKLWVAGGTGDKVVEYSLGTAWDQSSATFERQYSVSLNRGRTTNDVFFKSDGTKFYLAGNDEDSVHEYNVGTAWQLTGITFVQSFSVAAKETNLQGVSFKDDGTKMYVTGITSDSVHEYNLSTAWDISTAVFNQSISIISQSQNPTGIRFKPDGTEMYISSVVDDGVQQYSLNTAWDVSTAVYKENFAIPLVFSNGADGLFLKDDGTKLYTVRVSDIIWSFDL